LTDTLFFGRCSIQRAIRSLKSGADFSISLSLPSILQRIRERA
jgi:hypothetical protein